MKKALPFLLVLLLSVSLSSIAQDCYQSTRSQGISLFNQGKNKEAKEIFLAAKKCPDKPETNDLDAWISKCETTAPVQVGKFTIESITLDDSQGKDVTHCYTDEFASLQPKVVVNYTGKSKKKAKVSLSIKDRYGDMLESEFSDKYSETIERTFNKGKAELEFAFMQTFTDDPIVGVYFFEVLIDGKLAKTTSVEVLERPTTLFVNNSTRSFEVTLDYGSGSQSFAVRTNDRYEIKHKPSWINIDSKAADSFTISYTGNTSSEIREGMMEVATANGKKTIIITLKQDGKPVVATMSKPKSKIGLGFCLPGFTSSASNELGSVIDYGVTDVPSLAFHEVPNYMSAGGFSIHYGIDIPIANKVFIETGLGLAHFSVKNNFTNDDLLYTLGDGTKYNMDYGCQEKYNLNYMQIPALLGYELRLGNRRVVQFTAGVVASIGVSATCKLEKGYSNYTTGDYYGNSTYSGKVNLFSGDYSITQNYSTGQQPTFKYEGEVSAPFKRFDMGFNIGSSFVLGSIEVGLAYYGGLMNIARDDYFSGTNRVGGCLFAGDVIRSAQGMNDYKHRVNNLQVFVNYYL